MTIADQGGAKKLRSAEIQLNLEGGDEAQINGNRASGVIDNIAHLLHNNYFVFVHSQKNSNSTNN